MIDVVATIDGTALSPHFCTHCRPASAIRSVEALAGRRGTVESLGRFHGS